MMSGMSTCNFPCQDLAFLETVPRVLITIGITITLDTLWILLISNATISDNNIGQWLPFSPIPPAQCCFAGSKKIERKVDIIGATLKEEKRGRAFF